MNYALGPFAYGAILQIFEKAYTKMAPQGVQTPLYATRSAIRLEPYGAIYFRMEPHINKIGVVYSYNEVCSFIVT